MKYRAIIFDLDGTLLNTLQDLALSVNAVLRKNGLTEHPVDAYRYFVGDGIDILVERAFPDRFIEEVKLDYIVRAVKEEYGRRWSEHTVPYPGIAELLSFLQENSIPKAVFSNKPHEFAVLTVETLLPDWEFVEVRGIGAETPRKPDPEGALLIAERIGFEPGAIIYLGDTDTDMRTAVRGGFYPVGALWGFRPAAELTAGGAVILAEKPIDLVALFKYAEGR